MRRRELITLLAAAAALSMPSRALAQEPGRIYRIGGLHSAPRDAPHHLAFMDELRRLGFVEGQNLVVDWRGYGQPVEKFDGIAGDLVRARVDLILVGGDAATRAALQATKTIPILGITDDMVGKKFVRSLAKPEGNVTGVSLLAPDLDGKRQEILTEAVPGLRRMAALADLNTTTQSHLQSLQDAARERGVELAIHGVSRAEDIAPVIEAAKASGAAGLNVMASALLFNNRQIILARTAALRLPAVYQWPEIAEEGGLVAYGPRIVQLYRDVMTRQFVKLLNGTKLTDVPVEQPTHFELVINLKAAKQIGHEVPAGLVLRADKVVE